MSVQMRVEGLDEISKALKQLGGRAAVRAMKDSTRKPARTLASQLKRDAPRDTGDLKRSIRASRPYGRRSTFGTGIKMSYYGAILHGGEDAKRGVSFKDKDWISRSVMSAYRQSIDVWSDEVWRQIARQWDKYVKTRRV